MYGTLQMEHCQFCMLNENPARFRKLNALAISLKKYDAQLRFEVLNLFGEPRLGQMEARCCPREIKLIG